MGQALAVQVQGKGVVSADNLNTYQQTCDNVAALRAFVGAAADNVVVQVYMRGFVSPGDGGQGIFYWNPTGSAGDDGGITTIVPIGSSTGEWARLGAGGSVGGIVSGPGSSTNGFIPQWNGTGGNSLSTGLPVGTTGNNTIIQTGPAGLLSASIVPSPAVATATTLGIVKPDNTTITIAGGVLSAAAVVWSGPVLITTLSASSSASLTFNTLSNTYKSYEFRVINLTPATNAVNLQTNFSTNGGSSYDVTSVYSWGCAGVRNSGGSIAASSSGTYGDSKIVLNITSGNSIQNTASYGGINGVMRLYNPAGTASAKMVDYSTSWAEGATYVGCAQGGGQYQSATAVNAIQFLMSAGNITSGSIEVWGIP
jgi:hypothetical protein